MLLGAVASGLVCAALAWALRSRLGAVSAVAIAGLLWSLVVVGLLTLLPANGAPGWVFAEDRLDSCSWDIGGPAPDGFWIFSGGQRLLNAAIFAPSGALLVVAAARWRSAWVTVRRGARYRVGGRRGKMCVGWRGSRWIFASDSRRPYVNHPRSRPGSSTTDIGSGRRVYAPARRISRASGAGT